MDDFVRGGSPPGARPEAMPFDEQLYPDIQPVLNAAAMLDFGERCPCPPCY